MAAAAAADQESGTAASQRTITVGGESFVLTDKRDVSHANGFSHIRNGLIHDRSFAWDEEACDESPRWDYALEFLEGEERVVVALAFNCPRTALVDTDRTASIRPVAAVLADFLREQFPPAAAAEPAK